MWREPKKKRMGAIEAWWAAWVPGLDAEILSGRAGIFDRASLSDAFKMTAIEKWQLQWLRDHATVSATPTPIVFGTACLMRSLDRISHTAQRAGP